MGSKLVFETPRLSVETIVLHVKKAWHVEYCCGNKCPEQCRPLEFQSCGKNDSTQTDVNENISKVGFSDVPLETHDATYLYHR